MSYEDGAHILHKESLKIEKLKQQMQSRQAAVKRLLKKLKSDKREGIIVHNEHISNQIMYCQQFIKATEEQIERCEQVKTSVERVYPSLQELVKPSMTIASLRRLINSTKEFNKSFRKVLGQIDAYYNKLVDYDSYVRYVQESRV